MQVLIVCSGNAFNGISPLIKAQIDSLKYKECEIDIFSINKAGFWGYFSAIIQLRDKIKEFGPNIIHAHYGLSGLVVFLTFTRRKVIISFMGDDLLGSVGHQKKYTLFSKFLVTINKALARYYYDFSITKSKELCEILKKVRNKVILANGVNLKIFYYQPIDYCRDMLNIKHDEVIVLFASNPMRAEKNFSLAEASISLIDDINIKLLPVYSEEQAMLNLYYNAADLLLLTSFHEGSPNIIKEALACGCPIVTTPVGDVKDVLKNTKGCYITEFDPSTIARHILMAIEFRRKNSKTDGYNRLIQLNLDSESVAEKLFDIYKKLLTQG